MKHALTLFLRGPAAVVHGYDDTVAKLEHSVKWVREASVNMRGEGVSGEVVAERRLLEVSGAGHGVESALPHALPRFTHFFGLNS